MTRKYTKRKKNEEVISCVENGIRKKRITINIDEYPELYNKLIKLSRINVRTIEQQALYYIIQAVGETQVTLSDKVEEKDDKCE